MTRRFRDLVLAALACLVLLPAAAHAQSTIVGTVKDTSGAVLPGVTVDASSDVLIEKTRSVVTDSNGQYRIVDLRPGVYVMTFTLPGFATVRRENVDLPANFTSSINIDMKVGSLEESITVSADSPIVDVQTAVHSTVLNREAVDAIPTGRTIQGMGQLIVGISLSLPDTGGARAMQQTYMSTHGMTTANTTVMVDGMIVNGLQSDGAVQSYFNDAMNQEVAYQTSGIGAETSGGGVRLNMIPREGGNTFSGDFKSAYRPDAFQSDGTSARLESLGVVPNNGNNIQKILDMTFSQGGPIKKDKLWFFGSARYFSVNNYIPNTFFKDGSRGVDDQFIKSGMLRATWQIAPKVKFTAYHDEVDKYRGHDMQAGYDPDQSSVQWFSPAYHTNNAKLSSPVTSRLLLEGGFSSNLEYYTNSYQDGIEQPRGSAAWYANTAQWEIGSGAGLRRAAFLQTTQSPARYNWQGSASYVTGSHNMKVGIQYQRGTFYHTVDLNGDLVQRYSSFAAGSAGCNNGVVGQQGATGAFTCSSEVMVRNTPSGNYGERLNYDYGLYVSDTYTMNRLTLTGGIRYEAINAGIIASVQPQGRWVSGNGQIVDERNDLPNWKNWAPRLSAVYDVFGNAKTAIKWSLNRYNQARTTGIAASYNPVVSSTAFLTWRDVNNDGIAQGERGCAFGTNGTPGCEINSATLPANFGLRGVNVYNDFPRVWNLENGLELQHELFPRLSVAGMWFHGNFNNLTTTINTALVDPAAGDNFAANSNWTPFTVYDPTTGEAIQAYSRKSTASNSATNVDSVDPSRKMVYNAYNFEFRARPGRGSQVFGGFAFERQRVTNCNVPDNPNNLRFCDDTQNNVPFSKQFKLSGSYPMAYGIQVSASFQSVQGSQGTFGYTTGAIQTTRHMQLTTTTRYPANCPAPCPAGQLALPAGFLGNVGSATTLFVQLTPENAFFTERVNQLDFKVQKTFKVSRFSISPQFEAFNLNNTDAIITYQLGGAGTNVLSPNFGRVNGAMQPRMMGVGLQVKW